jgi:hypothetical protein
MKLELWEAGAHKRYQALQISLEKLLSHRDLVVGAMGTDWLETQAIRIEAPFRNLTDIHPLYTHLTSPNDPSLVTVCELGEYLTTFKNDPAIGAIISDLRSDKFESTLAELATAYRWLRSGVDVKLHPPVPSGEADFEAVMHEMPYVVEVSSVPAEERFIRRLRLGIIISDTVKDVFRRERPVAVKARIHEYPPGDLEGQFRGAVQRTCRRLRDQDFSGAAAESNQFWEISAEEILPETESNPFTVDEYTRVVNARNHDWDSFAADVAYPTPDGLPTVDALESLPRTENARVFLKFPAETSNPYEKIRKKLKKELRQLSGVQGPRIVVLELTGLGEDVFQLAMPQLRNEILHILTSAPELASVWLVMRKWTTAFRHKYFGVYVPNPESTFQLPHSFLRSLIEFEYRSDFLGERRFAISTEEGNLADYARRSPLPRS